MTDPHPLSPSQAAHATSGSSSRSQSLTFAEELTALKIEFELLLQAIEEANAVPPAELLALRIALKQQETVSPLRLAVVGGFKRGKSSLINEWLGADVLPVDLLPETITINELTYSDRTTAEMQFASGAAAGLELQDLKRERLAPLLQRQPELPRQIRISYPSPLLQSITIIDTPGMGDLFRQFDDQVVAELARADVVIVVVSAIAPLSSDEQEFLQLIRSTQAIPSLAFAITMLDLLPDGPSVSAVVREVANRIQQHYPAASVFGAAGQLSSSEPLPDHLQPFAAAHLKSFLEQISAVRQTLVDNLRASRRIIALTRRLASRLTFSPSSIPGEQPTAHVSRKNDQPEPLASPEVREQRLIELRCLLIESEEQTQKWLEGFLERLDREVLAACATQATAHDLQKHLHFFLVDRMSQATRACIAAQWPRFAAFEVEGVAEADYLDEASMLAELPLATELASWVKSDNLEIVQKHTAGTLSLMPPLWGTLSSIGLTLTTYFARAFRSQEVDNSVRDSVEQLREQIPAIKSELRQRLKSLYERLGAEMLATLEARIRSTAVQREQEAQERRFAASAALVARAENEARLNRFREQTRDLGNRAESLFQRAQVDLERQLQKDEPFVGSTS
jgi:hypothetical protein